MARLRRRPANDRIVGATLPDQIQQRLRLAMQDVGIEHDDPAKRLERYNRAVSQVRQAGRLLMQLVRETELAAGVPPTELDRRTP